MKKNKKQYWKGFEQLTGHPDFLKYAEKEFPEELPVQPGEVSENGGSTRRDFLKMMGFGVAAASLAACEAPVRKAIPYLNKPEVIDPGIPNYYASTYSSGGNYCAVVVKTREGRPIKIEPNKLTDVSGKGTTAQVEASVLTLYDKERLTAPLISKQKVAWEELDAQVRTKLESISSGGGTVRIVSKTVLSPTTREIIRAFQQKYGNVEWITYDPVSNYGMVSANEKSFGAGVLPSYHFDRARVVVSFAADFLGTWINPSKFSSDFVKNRKLGGGKRDMSRHYQFESNLSLTGANADYRIPVKTSSEGLILVKLYNLIARKAGVNPLDVPGIKVPMIEKAANELWNNRGRSLVISGSNDESIQILVNAVNSLLGNYPGVIDLEVPLYVRQGNDRKMKSFVEELVDGKVDGVIFLNCNPVYDHPLGEQIAKGLGSVNLKVSTADRMDETADLMDYVAPEHHFLESWGDAMPVEGFYSLMQPAITPLFDTRMVQESLLTWAGAAQTDYYEYIRTFWKNNFFRGQKEFTSFDVFWDKCLYDGFYRLPVKAGAIKPAFTADLAGVVSEIHAAGKGGDGPELVLYEKVSVGDGGQANNPWLQEMPDPVTKACWDNYLTIPLSMARDMGLEMVESETRLLNLTVGEKTYKLPAMVQPGQARGTIGLAIGYGRTKAGRVGNAVGVNAYPLLSDRNGLPVMLRKDGVSVSVTEEDYSIPQTQTHHTFMNRDFVIQESTLPEYRKDPGAGRYHPYIAVSKALEKKLGDSKIDGKVPPREITLWKGHSYDDHHWAMTIDLNACTGCGACTVSCQAENNVAVVGPEEVLNRREMAWLRIDRYYSSEKGAVTYDELEKAAENPEVIFQPMMCQHCNNAPCETVCPVAATTHSSEGLNQMVYNRCIGTRYCANNCPYKVRRFNWFKYHDNEAFGMNLSQNNDLGKMVLNPDVTIRSRGVMEKCSFCIQRIQYAKLEAKKEGRRVRDGEVEPACASACPTEAIVFGDLKDPESRVAKLLRLEDKGNKQVVHEPRAFNVLEEVNTRPNIWYFTKIKNKDEA